MRGGKGFVRHACINYLSEMHLCMFFLESEHRNAFHTANSVKSITKSPADNFFLWISNKVVGKLYLTGKSQKDMNE